MASRCMIVLLGFMFLLCGTVSSAKDSSSIVFTQVSAKGQSVPVGTIIIWSVAGNPEDSDYWIECDGRSTQGYPELAAVVGSHVPDYQGMFLRGYGSQGAYASAELNVL